MGKQRVTINKSDGTSNVFDFTIPDIAGTYNVLLTSETGQVIDAGRVVVDGTKRTYQLTLGTDNGDNIVAGTFTTPAISYTLSYPAMPTGVAAYTISRGNTVIVRNPTSAGTATIYHGDKLTISATAATGYNNPTATLSQTTVTGNVTATITAGSVKSYNLTMAALPTGVASYSVTRTGTLVSGTETFDGKSSQYTAKVYHGDKLTITSVAATGFNTPTATVSQSSVTGAVTTTVTAGSVKTYALAVNGFGTVEDECGNSHNTTLGIYSITVTRTSSPLQGAEIGTVITATQDTSITVYHGDVLTATISVHDAYTGSLNWTSKTISGATTLTGSTTVKSFKLTIGSKPTGVSSYTVSRISSAYGNGSLGVLSNGATIYYGDVLNASATATTGYNNPTLNWASQTVTGNVSSTVTAGSVKSFTLSYPAKPTGVASYSISRTSSPIKGASTGAIVTNPTSAGTVTVYYNDVLSITASADTPYDAPTYKLSATTVTSNVKATVTAGAVKSYILNVNGFDTQYDECSNAYNGTPGLDSITVKVTSSPYKGQTQTVTFGQDSSMTVFYGDVLTATISVHDAYTGSLNWTSKTISGATTLTGSTTVKSFKLTIGSKPTGVSSYTVSRISSAYGNGSLGVLSNGATIYYGDVLNASATATTGYNDPTLNWTSQVVTGNVSSTVTAGSVKSFTLTISSKPTGVNTHTVSRTSSPLGGATTGALSNGATIYYGDVLSASATATTPYNAPTLNWTSQTVTGNVTSTATAGSVKSYKLTISSLPTGVASVIVRRTASPNAGASTGNLSNGATIYYGDTLTATATAATAYNSPTLNWTSQTVTGNVTSTATAGSVKSFTLTISSKPTGVNTYTVSRTSSPNGGATTGALSNGATIYYGDVLSASATATAPYNAPSLNWIIQTVTGNVTSTATAGSVKTFNISVDGFGTVFDDVCGNKYNTTPGLNSITVKVTSSPYGGEIKTTHVYEDGIVTVYYGDAVEASIGTSAAYSGSLTWTSKTITANTTLTGSSTLKTYKLTIGSKPTGVSSYTVSRSSSPYGNGSLGALSNNATIYYGDTLSASATATTGYNNPTLNWTSQVVTGNVSSTVTAGSIKSFTLSYPAKPTGVASYSISRTSSPIKGASTGAIVTNPTSAGTVTVYYNDVLSITASADTAFNAPTYKLSATTVTSNVTATVTAGSVKALTLNINGFGTEYDDCGNSWNTTSGLDSITVTRTSSPYKGAATGTLITATQDTSTTVYYGDVLTASISVGAAYNGSLTWTSKTITATTTLTGSTSVKSYTLSYPAKPTGVSAYTIKRTSSPYGGASTGNIVSSPTSAGAVKIYYGDVLSISATAVAAYNTPTYKLSATIVSGNVTATVTAGSLKTYTLTVPALPTGVASCTVSRTSSPYGGGSTGTLVTAGSSQKTATIYYGDVLSISATATSGYESPTATLSQTTVTGNVTATITAGLTSLRWRTIFSGTESVYDECGNIIEEDTRLQMYVSSNGGSSTKTVSGLKTDVPTKITGVLDYYLYVQATNRSVDVSGTGSNSISGSSGYVSYTFTLSSGSLKVTASGSRTVTTEGGYDECGEYYPGTSTTYKLNNATFYITSIEQYY